VATDSALWVPAKGDIVVLAMGLCVSVNTVRTRAVAILQSGDVVGRVGLLQLGHTIRASIARARGRVRTHRAEVELHGTPVAGHVLLGSLRGTVGLAVVIIINMRTLAESVSRERLLSLAMPRPRIGLAVRTGRLGKSKIKCSRGSGELHAISLAATYQDRELVVRGVHLEIGRVVGRCSRVVVLVFLEQVCGCVDGSEDRGQVRECAVGVCVLAAGSKHRHGHAIVARQ
jgi:hypothetical protein